MSRDITLRMTPGMGKTHLVTLSNKILKDFFIHVSDFIVSPPSDYVPEIGKQYRRGNLVLVLGAGVSLDHGLPDWNTLLQRLLLSTIKSDSTQNPEHAQLLASIFTKVFSPNPLIAARYLALFYKKNHKDDAHAFTRAVRDALYETKQVNTDSDLLKEIQKLCIAAGKSPNLDSIITFNFDNIIEDALDKLKIGVPYSSVYHAGMNPALNRLAIYHVHGFLPPSGPITEQNQLTLSEDLYHQQYTDVYHWSNLVQIAKFKEKSCLFIGSSLSDPNLRRLLDIAHRLRGEDSLHHYMYKKHYDLGTIESSLDKVIIRPKGKMRTKSQPDNAKISKELIDIMEKYETSDARSFGVGIIWIDDWKEIPKHMAKIQKQDD